MARHGGLGADGSHARRARLRLDRAGILHHVAGGRQRPRISARKRAAQGCERLRELKALEILISCQGGDYTNEIYPKLRAGGLEGILDRCGIALRMRDDAVIILDPVNLHVITRGAASAA